MSWYAFHLGQITSVLEQDDITVNMVTLLEPQSETKRQKLTALKNDSFAIVLSTKP